MSYVGGDGRTRCDWSGFANTNTAEYIRYHDEEWGRPVRNGRALWEKLILDGMQAGLSWSTILNKRDTIYAAFDGLDPHRVAHYGEAEMARLLSDPGIIRSRAKCAAAIGNAQAYLAMEPEFADFIWGFTDGRQVVNRWERCEDAPTQTDTSAAMSRELKRRGFKFVGPTICYAFMQAVGIVNDHEVDCHAYRDCIQAPGRSQP